MKSNKLILFMLGSIVSTFPLLSLANDVTFDNQSKHDIYLTMNHDSTKTTSLVQSGTKVVIAEKDFKDSCEDELNRCEIEISKSRSKEIANVIFESTIVTSYSNTVESNIRVSGLNSNVLIIDRR